MINTNSTWLSHAVVITWLGLVLGQGDDPVFMGNDLSSLSRTYIAESYTQNNKCERNV